MKTRWRILITIRSHDVMRTSSLSGLRRICCANGRNGPYFPLSHYTDPLCIPKTGKSALVFPTRLARVAQVRQVAGSGTDYL